MIEVDKALTREEPLARFIFESNKFSRSKNCVKPGAFLPEFYDGGHEASVSRVIDLDILSITELGKAIGVEKEKDLLAWGEILVKSVVDVGLGLRVDAEPPRHAAIIGWPATKPEQMSYAQRLAAAATLRLPASRA